jgi:hypothetical protein
MRKFSFPLDMLHHLFVFNHVEVWLASTVDLRILFEDTFVYVIEQIAHNLADNLLDIPHASYNYGTFPYHCICRFVGIH